MRPDIDVQAVTRDLVSDGRESLCKHVSLFHNRKEQKDDKVSKLQG